MSKSEQPRDTHPVDNPNFDGWEFENPITTRVCQQLSERGFDRAIYAPTDEDGDELEGIEAIRRFEEGRQAMPYLSLAVLSGGERRAEVLGVDCLPHPLPADAAAERDVWKLLEELYAEQFGD